LPGIVFPHLETVRVEHVGVEDGVVRVMARTLDGALACPSCGVCSYRVHSRYRRHLADAAVAVGGCPVVVDLSVRRLFCDVADCARRTFAEQVEGLTIRYGRRTVVLVALVQATALALVRRHHSHVNQRLPSSAAPRKDPHPTHIRQPRGPGHDLRERRGHVGAAPGAQCHPALVNWALITTMTRRLTRRSPRTSQWTRKAPATG